jgi:hypothetical protein
MIKMIPFGIGEAWYLLSGWMFVAAIAWLLAEIYLKNGEGFVFAIVFLVMGFLVLSIPLSGTTGVVNMTICNKVDGVVISTSQQEYFLDGNRLVDMKSVVGKQITAHVYQEWPNQYPTIYDIDGPVPCGDATCGV